MACTEGQGEPGKEKFINLPRVIPNVQTNAKHQIPTDLLPITKESKVKTHQQSFQRQFCSKEVAQRCELAS